MQVKLDRRERDLLLTALEKVDQDKHILPNFTWQEIRSIFNKLEVKPEEKEFKTFLEQIPLHKNGQEVATLKVFFFGSGDPSEEHTIIGVAISGYGIGIIDDPHAIIEQIVESPWNI